MKNKRLIVVLKFVVGIFCLVLLLSHTFTSISFIMATRYANSLPWRIIWVLCGLLVLCNLWIYPIIVINARNYPERLKSRPYIFLAILWGLGMILLPYGAWEYARFASFLSGF